MIGYKIDIDSSLPQIVEISTNFNYQLQIDPLTDQPQLLPTPSLLAFFNIKKGESNLIQFGEDNSPILKVKSVPPKLEIYFKIAGTGQNLPNGIAITGQIWMIREA